VPQRNARSYKTDESFLEKIAIGAIGTKRVFHHLESLNHRPIALDRGSMSFKLWKAIKIKRLRVPDILCVASGIRVESRAKTKLEISMSHSTSDPDRGWDYGLDDADFIAFPLCTKSGDEPVDWEASDLVQYVNVAALRNAYTQDHVIQEKPKGAQEGFEIRLTWPCSVASSPGLISSLSDDRLQFKRNSDNRTITLSLKKKEILLSPQISLGDRIQAGQIVASVVPIVSKIPLEEEVNIDYYLNLLDSSSLSDRYAASKALSYFPDETIETILVNIINDTKEHIYVKLEAAATLMRMEIHAGFEFIRNSLESEYLEHRLETVIVLSEIKNSPSCQLLKECLTNQSQHPEIRAGAAWGLGELQSEDAISTLIESFLNVDLSIRIEAARSLSKLAELYRPAILSTFPDLGTESRPGVAWAIGKAGGFSLEELLPLRSDEDARHWIAYMMGQQNPEQYVLQIAKLKDIDPEVYFAINVLWKILTSWINGLTEY